MMERMKPLVTRPELLKAIADSIAAFERMSPADKEAMIRKQQESWARQDMD